MRGGSWSEGHLLAAILIVALLLRVACAIGVQWRLDHGSREVCLIPGDADGYWYLAGQIAAGKDYEIYDPPRRVMRMPGFPFLLALPRMAFGENLLAVRLWLAVIGTSACGFVYLLGRELCDAKVGLWAAAVTAISPVLAMFSVLLLSETAFAAAMTASLFALAKLARRLQESPANRYSLWATLSGALIAAATYLRPTWLLVGPMALVLLQPWKQFPRRLLAGVIVCAVLFLAMLPWGLRNQVVTGHFKLTTFWFGPSLYDGLNPEATGDSHMAFFDRDNFLGEMSEYDMDREYARRAKQYAWDHPGRALELMFIKLGRYAAPWPNAEQFQQVWMRAVVLASSLMILIPALYGTWLSRRRPDVLLFAWAPILYFAAVHMLFVGSIRYRLPAEYPLAVLSGVGLSQWFGSRGAAPPR